jgi:hypothetical protein
VVIDPSKAIPIPLKAKYRIPGAILHRNGIDPPFGTGVYKAGRFKSKSSNSGSADKTRSTIRPRRKAYGPW